MWSLLFFVLMIVVFGKILKFAIKATWSIAKIMVTLVFLPVILVGLVLAGLLTLALPILVVIGIVAFIVLND
jgi:hypothetical protein